MNARTVAQIVAIATVLGTLTAGCTVETSGEATAETQAALVKGGNGACYSLPTGQLTTWDTSDTLEWWLSVGGCSIEYGYWDYSTWTTATVPAISVRNGTGTGFWMATSCPKSFADALVSTYGTTNPYDVSELGEPTFKSDSNGDCGTPSVAGNGWVFVGFDPGCPGCVPGTTRPMY